MTTGWGNSPLGNISADWWRHADIWEDDGSASRPTEAAAVAAVRLQARAPRGIDPEWYDSMLDRHDAAVDRARRDAEHLDKEEASIRAASAADTAEVPATPVRRRSRRTAPSSAAGVTRSAPTVARTRPRGRRYRNGMLIG